MKIYQVISSLSLPVIVSCAHAFPSELQAPLIQPPLPQTPDPRRIILQTTSKSISGSYPLYDLLSISTESGSISVDVTPHSASSEDPSRPASLELKSSSGSVHVTFPGSFVEQPGIPVREYVTSVGTQSTSISGTFPLGSHTSFDSHSGSLSIELVVAPINTAGPRRLRTVSHSGTQGVRVVDDDFWAGAKNAWWDGMLSRHESHSGSINVEYPDSWEGTIEVETESGSISVTGRGVEIIREVHGRMFARKGKEGGGKIMVRAGSGSVNLRFG
ncbi:hypothetical protein F5B18DRAFT_640677 [Nemania serpens]|nr:hypothetical protein F5B18DRAFT_640677 [Nemania serpens]